MQYGRLIASLPMYDWPQVRAATDRLWAGIRNRLVDAGLPGAPDRLERGTVVRDQWRSPRLLFSQTCGYPLTHAFDGQLTIVATPVYAVAGCDGPTYRSHIIVNADSDVNDPAALAGTRCAYNTGDSLSGMLALQAVFAPLARDGRFFAEAVCSGSHLSSMQMVAAGKADVAAIDCVSYALAAAHMPDLVAGLKIIAESPSAPALPFVTAPATPSRYCELLRQALVSALCDPDLAEARSALFLERVEFLDRRDYDRVLEIENGVATYGYGPGVLA